MILKNENNRNSSIELLRILLMGGVIFLHYIGGNGQLLNNANYESGIYYLLILINSVFVCAVDVFILISGFYSCESNKINLNKLIQLLVQVIVFQMIFSMCIPLIKGENITIVKVLYNIIPKNYYVTLYVSLTMLSPFLNIFISKLSRNTYKKFLTLIILLFLMEPTLAEIIEGLKGTTIYGISTIGILGAEWGYTIVTFVCLYFIAAYIRLYGPFWRNKWNLAIWSVSLCILFVWKLVELKIGNSIGAEHYMNPVLVINSLTVFEFFRHFDFKSRFINWMAKGCFTVFILHGSIIPYFNVLKYLNDGILTFIAFWIMSVVQIFIICDFIGLIYTALEKCISDKIRKVTGLKYIEIKN